MPRSKNSPSVSGDQDAATASVGKQNAASDRAEVKQRVAGRGSTELAGKSRGVDTLPPMPKANEPPQLSNYGSHKSSAMEDNSRTEDSSRKTVEDNSSPRGNTRGYGRIRGLRSRNRSLSPPPPRGLGSRNPNRPTPPAASLIDSSCNSAGSGASNLTMGTTTTAGLRGNQVPNKHNIDKSHERVIIKPTAPSEHRTLMVNSCHSAGSGASNLTMSTTTTAGLRGNQVPNKHNIDKSHERVIIKPTAPSEHRTLMVSSCHSAGSGASNLTMSTTTTAGLRGNQAPNKHKIDKSHERVITKLTAPSENSLNSSTTVSSATASAIISTAAAATGRGLARGPDPTSMDGNEKSHDGALKIAEARNRLSSNNNNNVHSSVITTNTDSGAVFEYTETGEAVKSKIPVQADRPGAYSGGGGANYERHRSLHFDLFEHSKNDAEDKSTMEIRPFVNDEVKDKHASMDFGHDLEAAKTDDVANAVRPEAFQEHDTIQMDDEKQSGRQTKKWMVAALAGICCVIVAVVVVVVILVVAGRGSSGSPTQSKTDMNTGTNTTTEDFDLTLIPDLPNITLEALKNMESPEAQAFVWLMKDPNIGTYQDWRRRQRFALVTFYYSMNGPKWSPTDPQSKHWLDYNISDECSWIPSEREPCNSKGEIVMLNITRLSGFHGTLPPEMQLLDNLTDIDLSQSILNKPFAEVFPPTYLQQVQTIHCSSCSLEGSLPSDVGLFSGLNALFLGSNSLSGKLPTEIGAMMGLRTLHLVQNEIKGPIPGSLGDLTSLEKLELDHNRITGSIPVEIMSATGLRHLGLSYNKIGKSIPTTISALTVLEALDLENNALTGSLPSEIGILSSLNILDCLFNSLSGTIPTELGLLVNMRWLGLSANSLVGSIPSELSGMTKLDVLDLSLNSLTGTIPSELGLMTELTKLLVFQNEITGTIPEELKRSGLTVER